MKIGALILEHYKERGTFKKHYFDKSKYYGLRMVIDSVERNYNTSVDYISMKNINEYDVVLVSLTSATDVWNLIYTFSHYGLDASKVKPKIIIGGAGVINIKAYLNFGDFFVWGRGEKTIVKLLDYIENNKKHKCNNVFERGLNDFNETFYINQTDNVYPHEVNGWKEEAIGCKKKCHFCQYTYSRKYTNSRADEQNYSTASEEHTFENLEINDNRVYVSAIDGFTERLRKIINKPIKDKQIIKKLQKAQGLGTETRVSLKLFNICGYPTETKKSYKKFINLIQSADYKKKMTPLSLHILITPFSAEPLTPAQYLPMDLETNYRKYFQSKFVGENGYVWKGNNITLYFMKYINSNWAHFQRAIVNRGGIEDGKIIEAIVNNKSFKNLSVPEKMYNIKKQTDFKKYKKKYNVDEDNEWGYLESYISNKKIDKMAQKLHNKLGI